VQPLNNINNIKIQILIDNPNSWIVPFCRTLQEELKQSGYFVNLLHQHEEVIAGDILILLSCEKKFKDLKKNKFNLVVHESQLPQGKGWSPLTWQVLEGKKTIPVSLFEAAESIDSGQIYDVQSIKLVGHELIDELRALQFKATRQLIFNFIDKYPNNLGKPQVGESSIYPKRGPAHSQLDIHKSISEQFNLLRVVDNEKYPAFFVIDNQKYILKIYKGNT
jgi:methionyl-tRNA formyltransferase